MNIVLYLVVVAVSDGVGVHSSLLHLKEDPDCEDRLSVLTTQLHQDPVTDLHSRFRCRLEAETPNGKQTHKQCLVSVPHLGAAVSSPASS